MLAPNIVRLAARRAMRVSAVLLAVITSGSCSDGRVRGSTVVRMYDNAYGAAVTRIAVGDRVHFDNYGRNDHNVIVADSATAPFPTNAPHVAPGGSQEVAFPTQGVFQYYCSFHGTPDGRGMAGVIVVGDTTYTPPGKGTAKATATPSGTTRLVPTQYATIQSAVDAAEPGDLVLVDSGTYKEEVTVTTPSLVIRGTDRNAVIIDGEFVRGNGIAVLADGVAIENMTARNAVLNGFFWTGVKGYRGSYLTAYNNGDYGIYAFGAVDGLFEDSYASGSPDAGFYIGQCYPCRAVIRRVIAEHNALGYSGTNSGGGLFIVSSVFRNNRSGIVPSSLDSELDPPQRATAIIANYIADNNNRATPAGGLTPLGLGNGVVIAGGVHDIVSRNVIVNHEAHGVLVSPLYDQHFWPALYSTITNNFVAGSGRADIGVGGPFTRGTCVTGNDAGTTSPWQLQSPDETRCGASWWQQQGLAVPVILAVRQIRAGGKTWPDYKQQPVPAPQPSMPDARTAPVRPAVGVFAALRFNPDSVPLPAEALARRDSVLQARGETPFPMGTGAVKAPGASWIDMLLPLGWLAAVLSLPVFWWRARRARQIDAAPIAWRRHAALTLGAMALLTAVAIVADVVRFAGF